MLKQHSSSSPTPRSWKDQLATLNKRFCFYDNAVLLAKFIARDEFPKALDILNTSMVDAYNLSESIWETRIPLNCSTGRVSTGRKEVKLSEVDDAGGPTGGLIKITEKAMGQKSVKVLGFLSPARIRQLKEGLSEDSTRPADTNFEERLVLAKFEEVKARVYVAKGLRINVFERELASRTGGQMTHPGFLFDVSMASDTSKSLHVFEDCMTRIGKKVNVTSSAEMSSRPLEMRAMSELFCPSDYRRPADSRSMEGLAAVISNLLSPIMFRKSLATAQLVTFQSPLIKSNIPDLSGEQDFRRLMEAVFSHK